MGYDEELLNYFRNGANDAFVINILGSLRALRKFQQVHTAPPTRLHTVENGKRQQQQDLSMIDKDATTKDRERDRRKHRRDVDLRYMKTVRSVRDRFKAAYLCNKRHCVPLQQRLEQHKLETHSSDRGSRKSQCETQTKFSMDEKRDITTSESSKLCETSISGVALKSTRSVETECLEVHIPQSTSPYNIRPNQIDNSTSFDEHKQFYDTMNQCQTCEETPSTSNKCCNVRCNESAEIPKANDKSEPTEPVNSTSYPSGNIFHENKSNRPKLPTKTENINTDNRNMKNDKFDDSDNDGVLNSYNETTKEMNYSDKNKAFNNTMNQCKICDEKPSTSNGSNKCCNIRCNHFAKIPKDNDKKGRIEPDSFATFPSDKTFHKNKSNSPKFTKKTENFSNDHRRMRNDNYGKSDNYNVSNPYNKSTYQMDDTVFFDKNKQFNNTMNQCKMRCDDNLSTSNDINKCCNLRCNKYDKIPKVNDNNVTSEPDNYTSLSPNKIYHEDKSNRPTVTMNTENFTTDNKRMRTEKYNKRDNLDVASPYNNTMNKINESVSSNKNKQFNDTINQCKSCDQNPNTSSNINKCCNLQCNNFSKISNVNDFDSFPSDKIFHETKINQPQLSTKTGNIRTDNIRMRNDKYDDRDHFGVASPYNKTTDQMDEPLSFDKHNQFNDTMKYCEICNQNPGTSNDINKCCNRRCNKFSKMPKSNDKGETYEPDFPSDKIFNDDKNNQPKLSIKTDNFNSDNRNVKNEKYSERDNLDGHCNCPNDPSTTNNVVNRSGNTPSDIRSNKTIESKRFSGDPVRSAVEGWIQELPLFPGFGRESKEENDIVINDLIQSLHDLSAQSESPDYEKKLKEKISNCLNRLPIWYPGAKRDQLIFKNSLINSILNNISKIKHPSTENSNTDLRIDKDTEMKNEKTSYNDELKNVVLERLQSVNVKDDHEGIKCYIEQIADCICNQTNSLLYKSMSDKNPKLILVSTIVNILNDLPININCPRKRLLYLHKFSEDLANRLLSLRVNYCNRCKNTNTPSYARNMNNETGINDDYHQRAVVCSAVRKCFEDGNINCHNIVIEETGLIIVDFIEMPDPEGENYTKNEIINLLVTSTNLSEAQASGVAKNILRKIKYMIDEGRIQTRCCHKFIHSKNLSVYTSIEECSPMNYPITSTPKQKEKNILKLNQQQVQYMNQVSNLVRAWMDTLPENFSAPEDRDFKEIIIKDLAYDIMDDAKLEQLTSRNKSIKNKYLDYYIRRWLWRLNTSELDEVDEQIEELVNKINNIPVSILTEPQHGNRQEMANIKFREESWDKPFLPKGSDILEDQISIWMNEQPSQIFAYNNISSRSKKIQELAQNLENKLKNKHSDKEISNAVGKWLNDIVKPENKYEIAELAENLKDRVITLPQDATLAAKLDMKLKLKEQSNKELEEHLKAKEKNKNISSTSASDNTEQDNTMKMFISKYMEHSYDIDDPMARLAFNRLLKTHLQRLDPQTRKEVYDNLGRSGSEEIFPSQNLIKELEYIKDISDWLKNLPIDSSYNTLGNRDRIDFVNSLAMNIREIADEENNNPNAMNYNLYMGSIIHESLQQLPILKEYINMHNNNFMTKQLLQKLEAHRQAVRDRTKLNESIDTTGVNTDNIGDLIEQFIEINGDDIAHDEVKLEAWAIRLIREIKKMVQDTSRPSVLSKANVYNKLTTVPIPGNETAELFSLELKYIKEISHWIKNLPLLPINEEEENERVRKICELAEKITEFNKKTAVGLNDENINKEFRDYLTKWILQLPLDKNRDMVLPIVIKQLIKRIEKVKHTDSISELNFTPLSDTAENCCDANQIQSSIKVLSNKVRNKDKNPQNINNLIIDVIEKWSNALPLSEENEKETQNIRNDISRKLFQKVGQLNMDARVYNDDLLYREMLIDEIDKIFAKVQHNSRLLSQKDKLKHEIVDAISEVKNIVRDKSAGDTYKTKLENTIEASIPYPINLKHYYDPGFEIYKNRLATMFILDNFDHGLDVVKLKYEHLLRKEIDKYFEYAKHRNAVPLSKDEIYNELYSALFKVPIPNEAAIADEVEELKTRCEIDAWFEVLPLRDADGLNELLEWDKILSALAKKIHEIETVESDPDQIILKEIMKWLLKLPIQSAYKNVLDQFAEKLQKSLKSTAQQRKYVFEDVKNTKGKKGKSKVKNKKNPYKQSKDTEKWQEISCSTEKNKLLCELPESRNQKKKAADVIFETVQTWCNQLPICANSPSEQMNAQMIKDNMATDIMIKIGDLNMNPTFFNYSDLYNEMLDNELDRLFSALPIACNFEKSKVTRKYQLKEAIKSIKPLILEEKAQHMYKEKLHKTVDMILEKPKNITPGKDALLVELRNDIIDDFIQYKYNINDDESRLTNKTNMNNTVAKFLNNIMETKEKGKINNLMKTNQLISQLNKIPVTHNFDDRDDVEEIRMKNEVSAFLDGIALEIPDIDTTKVHYLKTSLAKKLNDIEMKGHTPENELKMKHEITRFFDKLRKQVSQGAINDFITKLKNNENLRRAPQRRQLHKCQKDCKGPTHSQNQGDEDIYSTYIPSSCNPALVPSAPLRVMDDDFRVNDFQYADVKAYNQIIECGPYTENNDVEAEVSYNKFSSEDENKSSLKCPCDNKKYKRCRGRPYCMVPMRWICEGCDGYNPFWCRMPLPGFM